MKIIDILNAKANETLKDGFKFRYGNDDYKYKKEIDAIIDSYESDLGCEHIIEQILNDEVEVIEENKEIEEKLDWEEIIGSVGKPVWDDKRKKWRVLDYYCREQNTFYVSFSDTNNREKFEEKELYFKERDEIDDK